MQETERGIMFNIDEENRLEFGTIFNLLFLTGS